MKKMKFVWIFSLMSVFTLANGLCFADTVARGKAYEITIANLTRGQVFSPPIVIVHNRDYRLFTLGEPASDQLYPLAENGNTLPLEEYISGLQSVFDYIVAEDPLLPGHSVTLELMTQRPFRFISAAGMLVTTNDAFFAVRDAKASPWGTLVIEAKAYDAGSEENTEDCRYIPGPPCPGSTERDTEGAEGFVHVHAGIHGIEPEGVNPADHDWRNPVAEITVRPVY